MKRKYRLLVLPILFIIATCCVLVFDDGKRTMVHLDSADLKYRPMYTSIEGSSINDRCLSYFQTLFEQNRHWSFKEMLQDDIKHDNLEMINNLVSLNIYNKCFMRSPTTQAFNELSDSFAGFDQRFYPYLSGKLPIFQNSNGEISYGPPKSLNYKKRRNLNERSFTYDTLLDEFVVKGEPYWKYYKTIINDVGIVISASDKFIADTVKLLNNLNSLGSELPIQLIHRGDLSNQNKLKLSKIRANIWFVDISNCLDAKYKNEFSGFFNKLLAYSFNTFKTMILLDNDVILFKKPEDLLYSEQFKKSKTLLFKDRLLPYKMSNEWISLLKAVSFNEIDQFFFGGSSIGENFWLVNDYVLNNYFHYMESGVVLIERSNYWDSVILSTQLPFLKSFRTGSWGDKEMFWLSLLISGYEDFGFNDEWSVNIGKINAHNNICTSHPGHILDGELIWMNSGALNCPKALSEQEIILDYQRIKDEESKEFASFDNFKSVQEFSQWYSKPISFNSFIAPTSKNSMKQLNLCNNYMWCVHLDDGDYQEFTTAQIKNYEKISQQYYENAVV